MLRKVLACLSLAWCDSLWWWKMRSLKIHWRWQGPSACWGLAVLSEGLWYCVAAADPGVTLDLGVGSLDLC